MTPEVGRAVPSGASLPKPLRNIRREIAREAMVAILRSGLSCSVTLLAKRAFEIADAMLTEEGR